MAGKILVINPGPKRRKKRGKMPAGLARYMAKKHGNPRKSRARRNPRLSQLFTKQNLKAHVIEPVLAAGIGGAASVALEVGIANIPMSDALRQNALVQNALRLGGAVLLGAGAAKVLGKDRGRLVTVGALTVAAANILRDTLKKMLPADWQARVKGLGGIADYVDYDTTDMGALQYSGAPLRGSLGQTSLGLIESSSAPALGGTFDPAFDGAFAGYDEGE